jgi:NAD(P)-dependent dehydrogenase (short-subunit alcohol dehydrogenase family)
MSYMPLKRMAHPEEIGKAIAYLASDDAGFITGAAFSIDGGSTAGHP